MFARMVFFKLEPRSREAAEKVVQELNVLSRAQKGFRGNSYFFEDHEGESHAFMERKGIWCYNKGVYPIDSSECEKTQSGW